MIRFPHSVVSLAVTHNFSKLFEQIGSMLFEDGYIAFNSLNLVPNPTGNAIPVIKRHELNKEIVFSTTAQATTEGIEASKPFERLTKICVIWLN